MTLTVEPHSTESRSYFMRLLSGKTYSYLIPLLPILIIFIVVQMVIFSIHYVPTARGETDSIFYMMRSTGELFQIDAFHGIGFPWAIRVFNTLGFPIFTSGRLVPLVAGLVFIFSTYLITYRFNGINAALIASVFIAFNYNTLIQSSLITSDMLAASLYISAIGLFLVPHKPKNWHFFLAGVLSGYAYLSRYVYIFLLILPIAFVLLQTNKRKHLFSILIFYVGYFLVTSPWMIYLYLEKGNPLYQENQDNIILKYMFQLGFPDRRGIYSGFIEIIAAYPGTFVESITKSLLQLPSDIFTQTISPIGIIGTLGGIHWVSKLDSRKLFFLIPNLIYAGLILLVIMQPQYVLALAPLIAIFVAASIEMIPQRIIAVDIPNGISRIIHAVPLRRIIVVGMVFIMLGFSGWEIMFKYSDEELAPEYMAAAQELQTQLNHKARLMSWRPHTLLWANIEFVQAEANDVEDLLIDLEENDIEYFAIDERYTGKYRAGLEVLLNPDENPFPERLLPVIQIDEPMRVIIYRYVPQRSTDS